MKPFFLTLLLLLPHCFSINLQEDDLVFDDVGDESSSPITKANSDTIQHHDHRREQRHKDHRDRENARSSKVERFWGKSILSKQVIATVGHIFKMEIPKHAFGGKVERYEARGGKSKGLPHWLSWDEPANTLLGVPSKKDVGQHGVNIKAFGKYGYFAEDNFTVLVLAENIGDKSIRHKDKKLLQSHYCEDDQDQTILTILLDAKFENLNPVVKVEAIENLAGFLGLNSSSLSIYPQNKDNSPSDSSILLNVPGNVKHRKEKHLTVIQWQVGCDRRFWEDQQDLIKQLPEQSKDGTLAEVLQLPVLLWRIKTEASASAFERNRRDTGSGDFTNGEDYDGYDDNEDYGDYEEGDDEDANKDTVSEASVTAELPHVSSSTGAKVNTETEAEHPHRHHHGEETIDLKQIEEIDEHDIVPILDHGVASGFNISSITSTTNTTTAPTPPSPSISTTMTTQSSPTTFTETRTTITAAATTSTMTTTTPTSMIPSISTETSTPSTTTITSAAGTFTTTTASETSSTVVLTTFPSNFNTIDDTVEKVKQTEDESDTIVPIDSTENSSTLSFMTTPQPSTVDVVTTVEKQEPKTTVYLVNVTSEEPVEETTVYATREPTTTPVTTVSSTFVPKASISTTMDTTSQHTQKTLETSSTTEITSTITTLPAFRPTIPLANSPPVLRKRMQKIRVFAGKTFSLIISNETFHDDVDGYTRNLHLSLQPKVKWIEFNNVTQEIYGIPLVEHISTHNFKLIATNSRGLSVSEEFQIYVQQPSKRVEYEFHLYLNILKRETFSSNVDWEFKVIRNLAQLFGDKDNSLITLTEIHMESNRQAIFSWTNDSLSTFSECPTEKIEQIIQVLVDKDGNPSRSLKSIFLPEINVTSIENRPGDRSQCSNAIIKNAKSESTTANPATNYNPMLRNQIDFLNCTVGQLFVFKVPEDTFYDTEGSTRNLNLSLRNSDGSEISPDEWLQFDSKNQEFYGVPMKGDVRSKSYMLEAKDKGGLSARDSLKVHLHLPPPVPYSVEFSMTLEVPYEDFAKSAKRKRLFIEKVCQLFGDRDTRTVSLESIVRGSTVVTWRNTTLPTDRCPNVEIENLRKIVVKEDKTLTDRVDTVMGGNDFPVKQITLTPLAMCLGELTGVHKQDSFPPSDNSRTVGTTNDEYLITFVLPAIIILAMFILAGIVACIFYKRRRSGKMSVSEQDDERQSFRNKGIPVIFQDELDEKPDPGNKSPIILKEEKPPLPPPEYQKTEDGADVPMLPKENSEEPYQPPPPFATNRDNNRQNRPKPTPTYRKPPPYVPP